MTLFKIIYWVALVLEMIIRAPFQKTARTAATTEQRLTPAEKILPGLLTLGVIFFPLLYSITHWLDFANYELPPWLGWFGVFLMACAIFVFARAHKDLKSNWSPTLEIRKDHMLITNGIYRYIRHPMYASQWLWVIAQILLLQNWIAGPIDLLCFIPFYFLRVPAEEKMMIETFGDQYREYMHKVGGVIPK